jgi:hypothetical protein
MLAETATDYANQLRNVPNKMQVEHSINATYAKNIRHYLKIVEQASTTDLKQPFRGYDELRKLATALNKGGKCARLIQNVLGRTGVSYRSVQDRLSFIYDNVSLENYLNGELIPVQYQEINTRAGLTQYVADWMLLFRVANINTLEEYNAVTTPEIKSRLANEYLRWSAYGNLLALMAAITVTIIRDMDTTDPVLCQIKDDLEFDDISLVNLPILTICSDAMALNNLREYQKC